MASLIDPKLIRTDLNTQFRVDWHSEVVKEYAEAMEAGTVFPPILVFYDDVKNLHILADGFHRLAAHKLVRPNDWILTELRLGTVEAARWASLGANQSHGIRRTNSDKRNIVIEALKQPKGSELSDRQIGNHLGVDHKTVASVRRDLEISMIIPQSTFRTGLDGRTINISRIGFSNSSQQSSLHPKTCLECRYFENDYCFSGGEEKLSTDKACEYFAVIVPDPPVREVPPPDYDHVEPCDDDDDTPVKHRLFQNRRLKNTITVPFRQTNLNCSP
ncbi:MAG: hypothetical protein LBP87_10340 [Planctomycetaceae bacterium]|nr:hypothetical protein [Planctomycetaceae bacterium]